MSGTKIHVNWRYSPFDGDGTNRQFNVFNRSTLIPQEGSLVAVGYEGLAYQGVVKSVIYSYLGDEEVYVKLHEITCLGKNSEQ